MASDLEVMLRRVRENLQEGGKYRYKKVTTTSAGASAGTTVISTGLTEVDDFWNGTECVVLSGSAEGQRRLVEDFANATGTLSFTNDPFPIQIASGVSIELSEGEGSWSGEILKRNLIDAINELAGTLPKVVLRDYIVKEEVGGISGLADPPANALDIHFITIDGKPAIEIPPEESNRLRPGEDYFLSTSTSNRYLYIWQGKDSTNGQLKYAPIADKTIAYHKVPLMLDFEPDGSTYWPDELWEIAIDMATARSYLQNQDTDLAQLWENRVASKLRSRGVKVFIRSKQEGKTGAK